MQPAGGGFRAGRHHEERTPVRDRRGGPLATRVRPTPARLGQTTAMACHQHGRRRRDRALVRGGHTPTSRRTVTRVRARTTLRRDEPPPDDRRGRRRDRGGGPGCRRACRASPSAASNPGHAVPAPSPACAPQALSAPIPGLTYLPIDAVGFFSSTEGGRNYDVGLRHAQPRRSEVPLHVASHPCRVRCSSSST